MKSHRDRIADLEDSAPPDFDPESQDVYHGDEPSGDEGADLHDRSNAELDGREHYEEVGPSSFRRPEKPVLGERYAGSAVRRDDLIGETGKTGPIRGVYDDEGGSVSDAVVDDDPFAPVEDEFEQDVFTERAGGRPGSSKDGDSDVTGEVSTSDLEDDEIDSDESAAEDDAKSFDKSKSSRSKRSNWRLGSDLKGVADSEGLDNDDSNSQLESGDEANGDSLPSSEEEPRWGSSEDVDMPDSSSSEATSDLTDATSPPDEVAGKPSANGDRAALKALLFSSDSAAVASSLSIAAAADATKGRAVKAQYQTYDRLLDTRIKMQKGLTAANSLTPAADLSEHRDAIQAAEEAAIALWNTITSIRHAMMEARNDVVQPGTEKQKQKQKQKKRKRPAEATTSTPLSTLWSTSHSITASQLPHHRAVLEKWSTKIRASNPSLAANTRPRQLGHSNNNNNSITQVIDAYLSTETEKLIQQSTTTPPTGTNTNSNPSTATAIAAAAAAAAPALVSNTLTYNDTTFYQSLLRDLISSRSSITTTTTTTAASSSSTLNPNLHPHTPNPTRRKADTKASKGRKIRYTTHEKLQNFMAAQGDGLIADPQGGGGGGGGTSGGGIGGGGGGGGETGNLNPSLWASDAARSEFFASLMGQRRVLVEDDDGDRGKVEKEEADLGRTITHDGGGGSGIKLF